MKELTEYKPRNIKLTDTQLSELYNNIRRGNFTEDACTRAGISVASYYNYKDWGYEDMDNGLTASESLCVRFLETIKKAEADLKDECIELAKTYGKDRKSWEERYRFLESRFPAEFKREITVTHQDKEATRTLQRLLSKKYEVIEGECKEVT